MTRRLEILLLGSFQVLLGGEPVTRFGSDTGRALLAYLALHPGLPLRREMLAGLLWPETLDAQARHSLRVTLSRLRTAIGDREREPPFLQAERQTILWQGDERCFVDVLALRAALAATQAHAHDRLERCDQCALLLQEATDGYRGEFLTGFSLDSAPFEEWMVVQREGLHWETLEALSALSSYRANQGEYEAAIQCARRQVELEPWREGAHRQWMHALALSGHRAAALAQYETCRRILADELGVEPEPETQSLREQILDGTLASRALAPPPAPPEPRRAPRPAAPSPRPALAQPEGERRVVTALSVGFVGSGAAMQGLDPELWAELVGEALRRASGAVDRYGGEVSQVREDGLVALFGASSAHEDDPERALLAALEIGQPLEGSAADLARGEEIELQVQMGVCTGEAVVTPIGDGPQHSVTALGDVMSLSGEIERAAEPGTVLVGETTYRLAWPAFEWMELGELQVRRGAALGVYRPLQQAAQEDSLRAKGRGIPGLDSPLVGRDAEVGALQQAIEALRAGNGGMVTVVGDAGIGKSRLVAEIRKSLLNPNAASAAGLGLTPKSPDRKPFNLKWLEGRCLSYTTTKAYRPWLDVLRGLLGIARDSADGADAACALLQDQVRALCGERASDVYPYLARLVCPVLDEQTAARLRGLDAEGLRVLTFRAWETLLDGAAAQHPLVLVFEDLHWADPTSLALLEHLLPLTERLPLLLVCAFRPLVEHGCWRVREVAARELPHRHTDLWLEPLSAPQSAELVSHLLRIEDLAEPLRARILAHAEGNPFYLEEILRSLIDAGVLIHDETTGRWHSVQDTGGEQFALSLPDTLRGVLMARIDRLHSAARHVLQLASVVGRIFERRVLENLVQGKQDLDDDLDALQQAQMIRVQPRAAEASPAGYIFKHQLTQEAAYESLLRRKRRELHRRVAQVLEQLYPERVEEQLGLLAHHWERARDLGRAIGYLQRAGDYAAAQYANDEAVAHYSHALTLDPREAKLYALLMARERVHDRQGNRNAQHEDLVALEEMVYTQADHRRTAELSLRQANYAIYASGDKDAGIAAVQRAVHHARAAGDLAAEAEGHLLWAKVLGYLSQTRGSQCVAELESAIQLSRNAGRRDLEADSLRELGFVHQIRGEYAETASYQKRSLDLYRAIGARLDEGRALNALANVYWLAGDIDLAARHSEQSLRLCRETGKRDDEAWALFVLGHLAHRRAEYTKSRLYHAQALRLFEDTGAHRGIVRSLPALGWLYHSLGDLDQARRLYEQTLAYRPSDDSMTGWTLGLVGLLARDLGEPEIACERCQQGVLAAWESENLWAQAIAQTYLGHVLVAAGRRQEAEQAYREALRLYRTSSALPWTTELHAGLARIALAEGDLARARQEVDEVLSELETDPRLVAAWEPMQVYLTCTNILLAGQDPRAPQVLGQAYRLLQERAQAIDDEALQRSFLENVAANREVAALYAERQ